MPHLITEQLRGLALKCQRLAADSEEKHTANEVEVLSTEIAQKAQIRDEILDSVP